MTKQDSNSPANEFSDEVVRKLTVFMSDLVDERQLSSDQFPIKEEKIEEIMKELYRELSCSAFTKADSITPLSTLPSPTISSSVSSLSFDGKSESFGASISESESTMISGVELVGAATRNIGSGNEGLSENMVGKGCSDVGENQKTDGCDRWEVGDEWLARVLGIGPPVLEIEEERTEFDDHNHDPDHPKRKRHQVRFESGLKKCR